VATTAVSATLDVARKVLPRGGSLPAAEFERRHRALVLLLWACALALPVYALLVDQGLLDAVQYAVLPVLFALVAGPRAASDRMRATAATLGLSSCAALGVAISGGLIEAHFAFFVLVVLLTLYEDWLLFGLAVAFVLLHHGIFGMLEPEAVFRSHNHQDPWGWAALHALFVAGAGIASVVTWRLNEDVRTRMRLVQEELAHAASADPLTGLPNRRALIDDLETAAAAGSADGEAAVLVLADLDNFKPYNDTFGHQAGDVLLQRLGRRLEEAVGEWGTAYRLGGDEFCVLARGGDDTRRAVEHATRLALSDHGDGFAISSALGSATLPAEAATAEEALRLADQRMYTCKMGGRASADGQTKDVLRRALAERHPSLVHDLDDLADLAARVARLMGLGPGEVDQVRTAAELHDVGKVAIPDAILEKPGDLDEDEWAFVKRHTIIGERIISAAPGLAWIGAIVRSTHERWDGTGYPDGRAGEEIPLAARIVSVCNAFDAMVNERPYRLSVTLHDALDEIRRGAGTQFDPQVVTAFERAVAALIQGAAA
jgi:diguanylate cyclase (GGDEF)-like protein